jgi:hypothetical protein
MIDGVVEYIKVELCSRSPLEETPGFGFTMRCDRAMFINPIENGEIPTITPDRGIHSKTDLLFITCEQFRREPQVIEAARIQYAVRTGFEPGIGYPSRSQLAFAWTQADDIPLILGQVNFFMEFDVCFYRAQRAFDVRPRN